MKNMMRKMLQLILFHLKKTNNNEIVFESEGDYCDNSRALFDYMLKNQLNEKYKITWIVENIKKYESIKIKNVKFITRTGISKKEKILFFIKIASTKYFFFTHPYWLIYHKKNQTIINLWHGTPIKAGGHDISNSFDYVICPSENVKWYYQKFMGAKPNQFIYLGYPRNDLLFENKKILEKNFKKTKKEKYIIVMPTYKQSNNNNDTGKIQKYILPFVKQKKDLIELNNELKRINIKLIIKIHHLQAKDTYKKNNLSNIFYLEDKYLEENGINLYNLIGECDSMITDFSSIIYDFSLCNKPIGFLTSEKDDYLKNRGFLVDNIEDVMVGERINNQKDFIVFCNDVINQKDEYKEKRNELKKYSNKYLDNKNCKRLVEYFKL